MVYIYFFVRLIDMAKNDKTNVMRILEKNNIPYEGFEYSSELTEGILIAEVLKEDKRHVFKTLVTESDKREHFVFVIPVAETLDLKAAARTVGVKSVAMIKQKELLPLTGYIHGGCSPIGMKKLFPTFIDETAILFERIFVSGGKVGLNLEIQPEDLAGFVSAEFADLA